MKLKYFCEMCAPEVFPAAELSCCVFLCPAAGRRQNLLLADNQHPICQRKLVGLCWLSTPKHFNDASH